MKTSSTSKSKIKFSEAIALAVRNRWAKEVEQIQFLNLRRLPARLSVQQAAWVIGVRPHSIQILVSYRLLKPIGTPARNEAKFFATAYVLRLAEDYGWQDLSTATLQEHWKVKNQRRSSKQTQASETTTGRKVA
jgi:hypothetical protein